MPMRPFAIAADEHAAEEVTVVYGTDGPDLLDFRNVEGRQAIFALGAPDEVWAGGAPDTVSGGDGPDTLRAGGGPDLVDGGNGPDMIFGGGGADEIRGGAGPDTIVGGGGPDLLFGGRGPDVFVYLAEDDDEHGPGGGGHDAAALEGDDGHDSGGHEEGGGGWGHVETIADFKPGQDRIDLSAFGDLTFASGPAAGSVWVETVDGGTDSIVHVDLDGRPESEPELRILLLGVDATRIDADDFIL